MKCKGGRGIRDNHIYALYRGDTYLMDGTLEEIAEKRVPKRQCLTLTRLDDDEDVDEDA